MTTLADRALEDQIAQWRTYVSRRQALHRLDVEELEGHLSASPPTGWRRLARISFCSSTWRGRRGCYASFLGHRRSFAGLERWQVACLPVYSVWAALVVIVFPIAFGYR